MSSPPLESGTREGMLTRLGRTIAAPFTRYRAWKRRTGGLLRQMMPRGLFARSLLIVIAPVVLMQTLVTFIFFERHIDHVTRRLAAYVSGNIALALHLYEARETDAAFNELARVIGNKTRLDIAIDRAAILPASEPRGRFSPLDMTLRREMDQRVNAPYWIDAVSYPEHVDIRIALDEGVMRVIAERDRIYLSTGPLVLLWIVGATGVLLTVAVLFLRNQIRPILRLARAAEDFGRGRDAPEFKPSGAREVRAAAQAVIEMKERISRHIQQRTEMLAGVSHDLRTPITRMKLELEMAGDSETREALKSDLNEMEHMLDAYLAFARGQSGEDAVECDLKELAMSVVANLARQGGEVELGEIDAVMLAVRPMALRRCLSNLLENARKHGQRCRLSLQSSPELVRFLIDDDGPGVPPDRREEAFRPFHRLDEGRNLAAGGVGLGLSIARDIARAHGGDVHLAESPLGGLRAMIELPR